MARTKRKENVTEDVGEKQPTEYIPTKDWYILTANTKTKEVVFYGTNHYPTIEALKARHNKALDLTSKGPYEFIRGKVDLRAPSYDEFLTLE
jgi:hypothetical protein